MQPDLARSGWRDDLILLPVIIFLFFSIGLSARPYMTPSEARYIEIPREMIVSGDWLTPHINDVPYFEKPPLFYWMQAAALEVGGLGEFSGRAVTTLLTTLTCLLSYALGRMLYGRLSGLMAATVLATCLLGYGMSRVAVLDVPVTLFITACLGCFMAARRAQGAKQRNLYWLMYLASALAVMTKGLIGMVLPGLVIGLWIALTGSWRLLLRVRLLSGLAIFLAVTAPWHWLMAKEHPDFLNFYFIHEHFTRYATDSHHRTAPWWFFLAITLAGLLPWTGLLPATLRQLKGVSWRQLRKHPENLLLVLWIAVPLVFFSLSHSKLASYIFVIFPPLAVLLGHTLAQLWQEQLPLRVLRRTGLFFAAACLLAVAAFPFAVAFIPVKKLDLSSLQPLQFLPFFAPLLLLCFVLCFRRRSPRAHILALALTSAGLDVSVNNSAAGFDTLGSRPLAGMLKPRLGPDDIVATYREYWQDLPVYLGRTVTVVDWKGELEYGISQAPETERWMIGADEFWKRCAMHQGNVFMLVKEDVYKTLSMPVGCTLMPLGRFGKTLMVKRVPAPAPQTPLPH